MDISIFEDDLKKKTNGAKVYLNADGSRSNNKTSTWLLIAALDGNQAYFDERNNWIATHAEDPEAPTGDEVELAHCYAIAVTVLLDWCLNANGEPLEYSVDTAFKFLSNPAMKRFKLAVFSETTRDANYRATQLEKEKKS